MLEPRESREELGAVSGAKTTRQKNVSALQTAPELPPVKELLNMEISLTETVKAMTEGGSTAG